MRLVRQVSLFFKEGNSDKVYEIDLCDTGNGLYVVNFRYGRRGTVLKEGTKTENAVSLQKAEDIFNSLEEEKRSKGYHTSDESFTPTTAPSGSGVPITVTIPQINFNDLLPGRVKAILKRLQLATEGKENTAKLPWKTSRIVWLAGIIKLDTASPFIIHLANKGDLIQQYAAAWSLGRIGNENAAPLLQSWFRSSTNNNLKRIAGESLLLILKNEERQKHLQHYLNSLPEPLKQAVLSNDEEQLNTLLKERVINQVQPHYSLLEDLYAVVTEYKWVKQPLKSILLQVPLKPNYFRHIRHIYKHAELRDDFEMLGMLSCKFEREQEMFRRKSNEAYNDKIYISHLQESVSPKSELGKKTSRIAYSNRTRQYLRKRTLRDLNNFGKFEDLNYVRLATGLLLSYDNDRDFAKPFATSYYEYRNGRYQQLQKQFPANAHAVYLNQILFGNAANMRLQSDNLWAYIDKDEPVKPAKQSNQPQNPSQSSGGFLKRVLSLFGKKKEEPVLPPSSQDSVIRQPVAAKAPAQKNDAPYIQLWNQLPQAYIQLLVHGRMNEIHQFALTNLQHHPDHNAIKEKIDPGVIELLLTSLFDIPADFGYNIALEKYNPLQPDTGLVKALLYSRLQKARNTAKNWVTEKPELFFQDSEWVCSMLFCPHAEVRNWVSEKMNEQIYSPTQAELICGRVIAAALAETKNNESINQIIEEAGAIIIKLFSTQVEAINTGITGELIKRPVTSSQVLGLKILLLKKGKLNYNDISNDVFISLLNNVNQPVREKCFELLNELSTDELLKRQELVINCCVATYHDVRINICKIVKRMGDADEKFGTDAVNYLAPYLMRKEMIEGMQKDVSEVLRNELIGFINNADKEMVLRLVYSQYVPTQEFGVAILEKYIDPSTFTIRQIIALGNHETLSVREWCWKYFSGNVSRIKFEREEAIRLLDAKWDDTREYAKSFFRNNFSENDWSPETLVGIADSVRPDIEAYGRELITRFFTDKDGEQYLLKLSQHPGEKMQLFATNYLERFAAGNVERIEGLTFYFRSVLSRVNKARTAKNRVFQFLLKEGKQSEIMATIIAKIITDISATVSIEDKAKCIEIMYELNKIYKLEMPMIVHAIEERNY
ncbi:MAG: WGR domain-containing protein [Chitinophagaceae bacterium]